MTDKQKIDIIHGNVESLRKEANSRIESDLKSGQTVVAGVAAIIVFRGSIYDFLPVAPILALLLVLVWEQSEISLFRLGRDLMREEAKINILAAAVLLDYESAFWTERQEWFAKLWWLRLSWFCLVGALSLFLISRWMPLSKLNDGGPIKWLTYIFAGGIVAKILSEFRRECRLFEST